MRSNLGAAWAALGRYEDAIDQYQQALAAEDDPSIRQNLAVALLKTGPASRGRRRGRAARSSAQPANRDALLLLADCRLRLGEDAARADLLRSRPRRPRPTTRRSPTCSARRSST